MRFLQPKFGMPQSPVFIHAGDSNKHKLGTHELTKGLGTTSRSAARRWRRCASFYQNSLVRCGELTPEMVGADDDEGVTVGLAAPFLRVLANRRANRVYRNSN
jgi:hypothetical protein